MLIEKYFEILTSSTICFIISSAIICINSPCVFDDRYDIEYYSYRFYRNYECAPIESDQILLKALMS